MTKASRLRGLLLMGTGVLVFLGTNTEHLPAEAFFPAVAVCLLGVVVFMKGYRDAAGAAVPHPRRAQASETHDEPGDRSATQGFDDAGHSPAASSKGASKRTSEDRDRDVWSSQPSLPVAQLEADEILLFEVDGSATGTDGDPDFVVTTDVSFPVELQETRSLADQLQKLERLRKDGVISGEEFAIAKAKLLR